VSTLLRTVPYVWRNLVRRPLRTGLTVAGIAVATFLFSFVESMRDGVRRATEAGASETTLVVYRQNRFCPFASQLPQSYASTIARIPGVRSAVPIKIVVNNCRASLDVVTFRGVPEEGFIEGKMRTVRMVEGSLDAWRSRGDAALVGAALAERRRLRPGDRFTAAGVSTWIAGIFESPDVQDRNVAYVHLPFLQESAQRGGTGGIVTQFNVEVEDHASLEPVAAAIDAAFASDQFPTTTRPESAFVARAARDVLAIVGFASVVGWSSLAAVFALIANAIALAVRDRVRDHAILQTLGFTGGTLAWTVMLEATMLGLSGGAIGAAGAYGVLRAASINFTMEGVSIEVTSGAVVTVAAIGIATLLGAFAGAAPAWGAARREIVHGLRAG
jgi:putative ABC transport system permease protein